MPEYFEPNQKRNHYSGDAFIDALYSGNVYKNPAYNPKTKKGSQVPEYIEAPIGPQIGSGKINDYIEAQQNVSPQLTGLGTAHDGSNEDLHRIEKDRKLGVNPLGPYNSEEEVQKARWDAQSGMQQLGNALMQAGVGEVLVGIPKGFLDIFDGIKNSFTGNDYDQTGLSKWFEDLQNDIDDKYEIYRRDPNKSFDMTDWAWWMSNIPSIATTLSLMVPAAGWAKGISLLSKIPKVGKAMKLLDATRWGSRGSKLISRGLLNAAGKTERLFDSAETAASVEKWMSRASRTMEGVGTKLGKFERTVLPTGEQAMSAILSRAGENIQEARQVYDDVYSNSLDNLNNMPEEEFDKLLLAHPEFSGLSKDDIAKRIARESANRTFAQDWWMVTQDLLQWKVMGSLFDKGLTESTTASMRIAKKNLLKELSGAKPEELISDNFFTRKLEQLRYGIMHPLSSIEALELGEGFEEMFQGIQQERGMEVATSYFDPNAQARTLGSFLQDPSIWEQGFWGMLGGLAFGGAHRGMHSAYLNSKAYIGLKSGHYTQEQYENMKMTEEQIAINQMRSFVGKSEALRNNLAALSQHKNPFEYTYDIYGNKQLLSDNTVDMPTINDREQTLLIRDAIDSFLADETFNSVDNGTIGLLTELFKSEEFNNYLKQQGVNLSALDTSIGTDVADRMERMADLYNNELENILDAVDDVNPFVNKAVARKTTRDKIRSDYYGRRAEEERARREKDWASKNPQLEGMTLEQYKQQRVRQLVSNELKKITTREEKAKEAFKNKKMSRTAYNAEIAQLNRWRRAYVKYLNENGGAEFTGAVSGYEENGTTTNLIDELKKADSRIVNEEVRNSETTGISDDMSDFEKAARAYDKLLATFNESNETTSPKNAPQSLLDTIDNEIGYEMSKVYTDANTPVTQSDYRDMYNEFAVSYDETAKRRIGDYIDRVKDYLRAVPYENDEQYKKAYDDAVSRLMNEEGLSEELSEAMKALKYGYWNDALSRKELFSRSSIANNSLNDVLDSVRKEKLKEEENNKKEEKQTGLPSQKKQQERQEQQKKEGQKQQKEETKKEKNTKEEIEEGDEGDEGNEAKGKKLEKVAVGRIVGRFMAILQNEIVPKRSSEWSSLNGKEKAKAREKVLNEEIEKYLNGEVAEKYEPLTTEQKADIINRINEYLTPSSDLRKQIMIVRDLENPMKSDTVGVLTDEDRQRINEAAEIVGSFLKTYTEALEISPVEINGEKKYVINIQRLCEVLMRLDGSPEQSASIKALDAKLNSKLGKEPLTGAAAVKIYNNLMSFMGSELYEKEYIFTGYQGNSSNIPTGNEFIKHVIEHYRQTLASMNKVHFYPRTGKFKNQADFEKELIGLANGQYETSIENHPEDKQALVIFSVHKDKKGNVKEKRQIGVLKTIATNDTNTEMGPIAPDTGLRNNLVKDNKNVWHLEYEKEFQEIINQDQTRGGNVLYGALANYYVQQQMLYSQMSRGQLTSTQYNQAIAGLNKTLVQTIQGNSIIDDLLSNNKFMPHNKNASKEAQLVDLANAISSIIFFNNGDPAPILNGQIMLSPQDMLKNFLQWTDRVVENYEYTMQFQEALRNGQDVVPKFNLLYHVEINTLPKGQWRDASTLPIHKDAKTKLSTAKDKAYRLIRIGENKEAFDEQGNKIEGFDAHNMPENNYGVMVYDYNGIREIVYLSNGINMPEDSKLRGAVTKELAAIIQSRLDNKPKNNSENQEAIDNVVKYIQRLINPQADRSCLFKLAKDGKSGYDMIFTNHDKGFVISVNDGTSKYGTTLMSIYKTSSKGEPTNNISIVKLDDNGNIEYDEKDEKPKTILINSMPEEGTDEYMYLNKAIARITKNLQLNKSNSGFAQGNKNTSVHTKEVNGVNKFTVSFPVSGQQDMTWDNYRDFLLDGDNGSFLTNVTTNSMGEVVTAVASFEDLFLDVKVQTVSGYQSPSEIGLKYMSLMDKTFGSERNPRNQGVSLKEVINAVGDRRKDAKRIGEILVDELGFAERVYLDDRDPNKVDKDDNLTANTTGWSGPYRLVTVYDELPDGTKVGRIKKVRNENNHQRIYVTPRGVASMQGNMKSAVRLLAHENIHRKIRLLERTESGRTRLSEMYSDLGSIYSYVKELVKTDTTTSQATLDSIQHLFDVLDGYKSDDVRMEEFLVETLSDANLMDWLNKHDWKGEGAEYNEGEENKSIFQKIMEVILRLFGKSVRNGSVLAKEYNLLAKQLGMTSTNGTISEINETSLNSVEETDVENEAKDRSDDSSLFKPDVDVENAVDYSNWNNLFGLDEDASDENNIDEDEDYDDTHNSETEGIVEDRQKEQAPYLVMFSPTGRVSLTSMQDYINSFPSQFNDMIETMIKNNEISYSCRI